LTCILLAAALSACGGEAPAPSPTAENGIRAKSAQEILDTARANAAEQSSVRIKGTSSCPLGKFFTDMRLTKDGQGTGTARFSGTVLNIVTTPTSLYVKADLTFWSGLTTPAKAATIGDKWVSLAPATNPCLANLGSFNAVTTAYLNFPGVPVKENSVAVFGEPAQLVAIPPDVGIWVSALGPALPIQVDETSTDTHIAMGEWSVPVTVEVPAPGDTIDGSQFKN